MNRKKLFVLGVAIEIVTPMCRHCQMRIANAPRGFCRACYDEPGMLPHYDSLEEAASLKDLPRPISPTMTLPGSETKIKIMRMRAERRCSVFHPDDLSMR